MDQIANDVNLCKRCGVFAKDNFLETEPFKNNGKKYVYVRCLHCGTCYKLESIDGKPIWNSGSCVSEKTFKKFYKLTTENLMSQRNKKIIDQICMVDEMLK